MIQLKTALGPVPNRWAVAPLRHCVELRNDRTRNDSDLGPPIGLEHVESWTGRLASRPDDDETEGQHSLFRRGDVLFAKLRPYLAKAHRAQDDGACSAELLVLRPRTIDAGYLTYCLLSPTWVSLIDSSTFGSKMPRANWEFIGHQVLPVPSMHEQRAIADFLDRETERIDALVAKKQRLSELLQEKRTALISHAVTKGLDPDVPMKDSGIEWLGPMPRHWRWAPLKRLLRAPLQYGASEAGGGQHEDGPRFIRITDIDADGHLRDGTACFIPERAAQGFLLDGGDVLFARSGATAGKTYLYDGRPERAAFAGYLIRASVNPAQMLPQYLRLFTQTHTYLEWVGQVTIQSTIQNVNAERYASLAVPLPPAAEQATIVGFVDDQVSQIDASAVTIGRAIELLSEYRSALITAAVTGQIDVGAQKARRQAGGS